MVQQASFPHNNDLVTIPGVKVYKDSSRLAVWYSPNSVTEQSVAPRQYELSQNYPNPFNPSTTIRYALPHSIRVSLKVYNTLGQEVATLVNETKPAGVYTVQFDAGGLASGVYYFRLQAGDFVHTKKMLVVR